MRDEALEYSDVKDGCDDVNGCNDENCSQVILGMNLKGPDFVL